MQHSCECGALYFVKVEAFEENGAYSLIDDKTVRSVIKCDRCGRHYVMVEVRGRWQWAKQMDVNEIEARERNPHGRGKAEQTKVDL